MTAIRFLYKFPFFYFLLTSYIKLFIVHQLIFSNSAFHTGILLEFMFILTIFLILEYAKGRLKKWLYLIFSFLLSLLLLTFLLYFNYYGGVLTYKSISEIGQLGDVKESIFELFQWRYLFLFIDFFFYIFMVVLSKSFPSNQKNKFHSKTIKRYQTLFVVILLVAGSATIYIYHLKNVYNELKKAENLGLFYYQGLVRLEEWEKERKQLTPITQEEILHVKGIDIKENPKYFGVAKGKDVLVIQLEAFQNFVIGLELNGQEITPNLNALTKNSFYFPNFFQQVGKGNTADAEFVMNTSILPIGNEAMSNVLEDVDVPSFPKILENHQYESMTFHTNDVQFWNRDEMYQSLGFHQYFDKQYFGEKDFIAFGASDKVLFAKTIEKINEYKTTHNGKHLYANIIAMSSHHPYKIPKPYQTLHIPKELEGTTIADYLQAVHYVDEAIGWFINALKENHLWDDTLLVIYGDHFGISWQLNEADREIMEKWVKKDFNVFEAIKIPLIIHVPQQEGEIIETIGSHVDIMPTVANLLGIQLHKFIIYFGQDLLNTETNIIPQRFYLPTGSFITDHVGFIPGEGYEDGEFYPLENDLPINVQMKNKYEQTYNQVLKLLELNDLYIHQLMNE